MVSEWIICMHTWVIHFTFINLQQLLLIYKRSTANPQSYSAGGKTNQYHAQNYWKLMCATIGGLDLVLTNEIAMLFYWQEI